MGSFRSYLTDWGMLGMHKRRAFERAVGGARDRLDLGQGRLRFSGGPSFYVQLLGTHAHATWLWGWANEAPLPAHVLRVAGTLRSWGERQGVAEMTSATVFDEAADPEALALVSCALTPCAGLYRCEADGGTIWLLAYGELDEQPLSAEDCLDTIHAFASRHAVDERRAVTSFFTGVYALSLLGKSCNPPHGSDAYMRKHYEDERRFKNTSTVFVDDSGTG